MRKVIIIAVSILFCSIVIREYFFKKSLPFKLVKSDLTFKYLDSFPLNCYISYDKTLTISSMQELYSRSVGPMETIDTLVRYIKSLDYENYGYIITFGEDIVDIAYLKIDLTDYNYIRRFFKWSEVKYSVKTKKRNRNIIQIYGIPNDIKLLDLYGG